MLSPPPRKETDRSTAALCVGQLRQALKSAKKSQLDHVNLLLFGDRSPLTVYPHTRVSRAFTVFRRLGMRHLCVIDFDGNAVGIITRKDLMDYKLRRSILAIKLQALWRRVLVLQRVRVGYYRDRKRRWKRAQRKQEKDAEAGGQAEEEEDGKDK